MRLPPYVPQKGSRYRLTLRSAKLLLAFLPCVLNAQQSPAGQPQLTRQQAEQLALRNNPRVRVSTLLTELQGQVVRETRSNELPTVSSNLTAVEANEASRLSAGGLTASRLLEHAGMGVTVNQLISDFGRTRNLIASERLREKARQADAEATAEEIILAADQAFFQTLEAQSTLEVTTRTVETRQALVDQVEALSRSKLKSELDLELQPGGPVSGEIAPGGCTK